MKQIVLFLLVIGYVRCLEFTRRYDGSKCTDGGDGKLRFWPRTPPIPNSDKITIIGWDKSSVIRSDINVKAFSSSRLANALTHYTDGKIDWKSNALVMESGNESGGQFSFGANKVELAPNEALILTRDGGYVRVVRSDGRVLTFLDEGEELFVKDLFVSVDDVFEWTPEYDDVVYLRVDNAGCVFFEASNGIDSLELRSDEGVFIHTNDAAINKMSVSSGNSTLTVVVGEESEENHLIVYGSVYDCVNTISTQSLSPSACVNASYSTAEMSSDCECYTCSTESCRCEKCESKGSSRTPRRESMSTDRTSSENTTPTTAMTTTSPSSSSSDQQIPFKSGIFALTTISIIILLAFVTVLEMLRRRRANAMSVVEDVEMQQVPTTQEHDALDEQAPADLPPSIQDPPASEPIRVDCVTETQLSEEDDDDDDVYIVPRGRARLIER
ncbi:uncharacterized protein LOC135946461 [Cloeon dipterum]|uniref:uncharacterized protein LOC135946461 n=1 Tax=Cloeon dipterum TaxID=197152 RepID=UPI00321F6B65